MRISDIKTARPNQLTLWEPELGNHGHIRNIIGELTEELIATLFGGERHKTDCNCDYCPDVSVCFPTLPDPIGIVRKPKGYGRLYMECKAAGRSNQTFIYEGRLEKDKQFAKDHLLCYAILKHRTITKYASTVPELTALFLTSLDCLYIVPFEILLTIIGDQEPEPLNSSYGGTDRKTYGSGYRIPLRSIEEWKYVTWENENPRPQPQP